ncbi:MAG: helix-turn-helix transcriptional regulator [Ktedonobacterales bacterium]|nr:helix-turn-helix transcriptional regulator [Ktedonobacterales bacterium]
MGVFIDGKMLRKRREAKGWDQLTLAQLAHIHPSVISRLERGLQTDLKVSVLIAIANALGVAVDSLLPADLSHEQRGPLSPEVETILAEIAQLSMEQQRHVAAILRGYLSGLPDVPPDQS